MTLRPKSTDSLTPDEVFGDVVRELRTERGLSQEQLGFASGLHRTYISLLERGKKSPTLNTLFRLAGALAVPPSKIVQNVEVRVDWNEQGLTDSDS